MFLADAAIAPWESIPWAVVAALLGAAVNYGALRPAINALKEEIGALRIAAAPITDIDKRLVRAETELAGLHRELARAFEEIASRHENAKRFTEQVRADIAERLREMRIERSNPGE